MIRSPEQRMMAQTKALRDVEKEAALILAICQSNLHDIPAIEQAAERIREKCRNTEATTIHTKGVRHAPD